MYFLIGGDGREYGPFTAEQIREWVGQGRANAHSRVRRDGETNWQAFKDLAEFADVPTRPSAPPPGVPPPALSPEALAADYLSRAVPVDVVSCITRGWELVRDNPGLTIGATLLVMLVSFGLSLIPVVGFVSFFIDPVLFGGVAYTFTRRIRGEVPSAGDAFSGFNLAFLQLGLGGVVSLLLVCVGLLLCVLPGVYLAIGYAFALPLVIDKKYDFWTAMEVSRRVVHRQWWTMFGLALVLFLLNVVGVLACLIGMIVTAPISLAAMMYAYEDVFGRRGAGAIEVHGVLGGNG
jgi:hypothetical protein